MRYQVNNCGDKSINKSSGRANDALLSLPSVKKAKAFLPNQRSESSFQRYDGTDYYRWYYRWVYWHPVGPLFKIKRKRSKK